MQYKLALRQAVIQEELQVDDENSKVGCILYLNPHAIGYTRANIGLYCTVKAPNLIAMGL